MSAPFRVGAARRVITPRLGSRPIYLAGFSRNRRTTSVHDDLHARALAVVHASHTLVIVSCDLIGLPRRDILSLRAAFAAQSGDPSATLVVACTHTHSGPDTIGLWGPDATTNGVNADYMVFLHSEIIAAALEALANLRPAHMCCCDCRFPGWIKNLRDPDVVDDTLAVARFETEQGVPIATLVNLACHPEVLMDDSHVISSDFAGVACRMIEEQGGGVTLFLPGALGGMLSPAVTPRTTEQMRTMGEALATAALAGLGPARVISVDRMLVCRETLDLPLDNSLFVAAIEQGLLRGTVMSASGNAENDALLETDLTYVDLGSMQIITIPGELFPRLGREIKAALPGPCGLLVGLADDELGYIIPDDEFVRPHDYADPGAQYEESMSLGPTTGSLVAGAALRLIAANRS